MAYDAGDIGVLKRARTSSHGAGALASVPRPRSRWKTRVALPLVILGAAIGLLVYSAREVLTPVVYVWVVPVVALPGGGASSSAGSSGGGAGAQQVLAQAPGWIEADPFPITVPALADGVIEGVLVLEGETVRQGQVVARLVAEDARLAVAEAEAELAVMQAGAEEARAALSAAEERAAEVTDEVTRKRALVEAGGVSEGEFARLEIRLRSMEQDVGAARAAVRAAEAAVRRHEVLCDEARLRLARTEIVSPVGGVVQARLVQPGMRIGMPPSPGATGDSGAVLRLYDPARLQVRVEVALADAAKVGLGTQAQIVTEAIPGKEFKGRVTRMVHEANIQRNTVQVKVAIEDPSPLLKPEMLTRVRFMGAGAAAGGSDPGAGAGPASSGADLRLIVPAAALFDRAGDRAQAWVVESGTGRSGPVAAQRDVLLGGSGEGGDVEVREGLRPGDRLIVDAPGELRPGVRVKVLGERSESQRN